MMDVAAAQAVANDINDYGFFAGTVKNAPILSGAFNAVELFNGSNADGSPLTGVDIFAKSINVT